eukprot:jgi/Picre1/33413/NNA_008737.t1
MERNCTRVIGNVEVPLRGEWQSTVMTLNAHCPILLTATHDAAGLGHAFMSFTSLLSLSSLYGITLNASFPMHAAYTTPQGQGVNMSVYLGFFQGDLFRSKFHGNCATYVNLKHWEEIAKQVEVSRTHCKSGVQCLSLNSNWESRKGLPVEFNLDVGTLRQYFKVPPQLLENPFITDYSNFLHIAVHLRRGYRDSQVGWMGRFVHNKAYLHLLPRLIDRVKSDKPIMVTIFVEGAESIRKIPDVNQTLTDDFSQLPARVRLGPREPELAIAAMCTSSILVTAPSSFSHMVAILCEKPTVLGVPFWHSFSGIPNALSELDVERNPDGSIKKLDLPNLIKVKRSTIL